MSVRNDYGNQLWSCGVMARVPHVAALVWAFLAAGVVPAAGEQYPTGDAAAIPMNGWVASYLFTGNAHDPSGLGHHGTRHHVALTSNRFRRGSSAYSLNGTNAYSEIPDHALDLNGQRRPAAPGPGRAELPHDLGLANPLHVG